ncbi:MAG TPA: hypothetical protein VMR23_13610, partial [Candidatus Limnocylindria bacterium]|nr:hypothetical protein [Candidatus Limnocylindria bacterium]
SPDELPSAAARRVLITRLGHALAGTCFATAAILAVVTLADLSGVAPPPAIAYDRFATDERIARLASRVGAAESRLQRADERVRRVEARLSAADDVRTASPVRERAARPRVAAPPPSPRVEPRVAAPAPRKPVAPAARVNPPPVLAEPRVAAPLPPPAVRAPAPQASGLAEARVVAPVSPKLARPALSKSPPPDDLGSRLRRDWETVKRGFTTAGTDFRAAVDEQARELRGAGD